MSRTPEDVARAIIGLCLMREEVCDKHGHPPSDGNPLRCVAWSNVTALIRERDEGVRADAKAEALDGLSGRLWALLQREDHDDWCHAGWECGCGCSCTLPDRLARGLGA